MDILKNLPTEEDLHKQVFSYHSDRVMENIKRGIYPSFDGIYYYVEPALLKNPHILIDAERIVKTIIWELGSALDDLPNKD